MAVNGGKTPHWHPVPANGEGQAREGPEETSCRAAKATEVLVRHLLRADLALPMPFWAITAIRSKKKTRAADVIFASLLSFCRCGRACSWGQIKKGGIASQHNRDFSGECLVEIGTPSAARQK
jgi:hypothetical protein